MSSEVALRVEGLSKCFHVYKKPLHIIWQKIHGESKKYYKEVWALKDITFDVSRGETVGIIGRNGSGKSTLLEIISDTLTQTAGEVYVNGRVAALLELGAGFNADFTGRENVFLSAAIMGLSRNEIQRRYKDVVDFSEIGDFIDQPVKTYSSGMYIRLAFAVAINMDPDILVVDEALSVGDVRFQRKCFRKFEELQGLGKTILFVTHSTDLVINHCNRAVFLDSGQIRKIGKPCDVVHSYLNFLFGRGSELPNDKKNHNYVHIANDAVNTHPNSTLMNSDPKIDGCKKRNSYNASEYRWGDKRAQIIDYLVHYSGEYDPVICPRNERIDVYAKIYFTDKLDGIIYGLTIKTVNGVTVYGTNTRAENIQVQPKRKGDYAIVCFQFATNLVAGDYFVSLGIAIDDPEVDNAAIDRRYDLFHLKIGGNNRSFGIADLRMIIEEH